MVLSKSKKLKKGKSNKIITKFLKIFFRDIEDIKDSGFTQYELPKEVDKEMMGAGRFGDPMAKLITVKINRVI